MPRRWYFKAFLPVLQLFHSSLPLYFFLQSLQALEGVVCMACLGLNTPLRNKFHPGFIYVLTTSQFRLRRNTSNCSSFWEKIFNWATQRIWALLINEVHCRQMKQSHLPLLAISCHCRLCRPMTVIGQVSGGSGRQHSSLAMFHLCLVIHLQHSNEYEFKCYTGSLESCELSNKSKIRKPMMMNWFIIRNQHKIKNWVLHK